jgi:bacterioferritin-associated ferredoxin
MRLDEGGLESMFVCVCHGITHRQVEEAVDRGATSLEELSATLGVATGCGTCAAFTQELLSKSLEARGLSLQQLSIAA